MILYDEASGSDKLKEYCRDHWDEHSKRVRTLRSKMSCWKGIFSKNYKRVIEREEFMHTYALLYLHTYVSL